MSLLGFKLCLTIEKLPANNLFLEITTSNLKNYISIPKSPDFLMVPLRELYENLKMSPQLGLFILSKKFVIRLSGLLVKVYCQSSVRGWAC